MNKDKENNPSRRDFLTMTSMGAATLATSLAATGLSSSAHAQDGKPQGESKEADSSPSKHLELLFLGTGAANWPRKYPFKDKNHSRAEVRAMSSMLVNGPRWKLTAACKRSKLVNSWLGYLENAIRHEDVLRFYVSVYK